VRERNRQDGSKNSNVVEVRRNRKVGMSLAFGFVFIAKVGIVADWLEAGWGV
jgi:hypothetical protein